jgi:hypothetical protein
MLPGFAAADVVYAAATAGRRIRRSESGIDQPPSFDVDFGPSDVADFLVLRSRFAAATIDQNYREGSRVQVPYV